MVTWAWGINGALSVLGATLAIFIAMNWGFRVTLLSAAAVYLVGLAAFSSATVKTGPARAWHRQTFRFIQRLTTLDK